MLWFVQQSFVLLLLAWVLGVVSGWLVFGRNRGWAEPMTDMIPVVEAEPADDVTWVPAEWTTEPDHHDYADPVWAAEAGLTDDDLLALSTDTEAYPAAAEAYTDPGHATPVPVAEPRVVAPRTPPAAPRTPPAEPRPVARPAAPRPAGADDLTRIDGVTPQIAEALRAAGLTGFGAVARAGIGDLRAALSDAGLPPTFRCAYWPLMASDLEAAAAQAAHPAGQPAGQAEEQPAEEPVAAPAAASVVDVTEPAAAEVATGADEPDTAAPDVTDVTAVPDAPAAVTVDVTEQAVDVTTKAVDVTDPAPEPFLDEFERIDGVTLSAARALRAAGITTFTAIAEAPHGRLREALTAAGVRIAPTVQTWGTQARRLAASDAGAARAAARSGGTGARL